MFINFYDQIDIDEDSYIDEDFGLVCDSKGMNKLVDNIKSMQKEKWEFVECKQESENSSIFILHFRKAWR